MYSVFRGFALGGKVKIRYLKSMLSRFNSTVYRIDVNTEYIYIIMVTLFCLSNS